MQMAKMIANLLEPTLSDSCNQTPEADPKGQKGKVKKKVRGGYKVRISAPALFSLISREGPLPPQQT